MAHRVAPVIQIQTSERQTTKLEMRMSKNVSTLLLTIATFNVLGLSSFEKRYSLAKDCFDYNIDILAIQETKCTQSEDYVIQYLDNYGDKHDYRLIIFEQTGGKSHTGLGFMINCKLLGSFRSYGKISERVTFVDFFFRSKGGGARNCRFVNCYGHIQPNTKNDPQLNVTFYKQLTAAVSVPANNDLYVLAPSRREANVFCLSCNLHTKYEFAQFRIF